MDCTIAQSQLLDAAEGELGERERSLLECHLAECPSCREELGRLRAAIEAVRAAADELAPQTAYLSSERLGRLMVAYGRDTRVIRLRLHRGVVAAAAVAAILVSAAVIAISLPRALPPAEPGGLVASGPPLRAVVPVVLTTTGQDEPMRVFRTMTLEPQGQPEPPEPGWGVRFVGMNSAGVSVPAHHVFYDPEESSRWW